MLYYNYLSAKGWMSMSIDQTVENAIASLKMEGYQVDSDSVQWCKKLLAKEISLEQYIAIVKQKLGIASI